MLFFKMCLKTKQVSEMRAKNCDLRHLMCLKTEHTKVWISDIYCFIKSLPKKVNKPERLNNLSYGGHRGLGSQVGGPPVQQRLCHWVRLFAVRGAVVSIRVSLKVRLVRRDFEWFWRFVNLSIIAEFSVVFVGGWLVEVEQLLVIFFEKFEKFRIFVFEGGEITFLLACSTFLLKLEIRL